MARAALFILVGVVFFVDWVLADPGYEASESRFAWDHVLAFSAALLGLAAALPVFARLAGGPGVSRAALVGAAGAALGSLTNILEDGLQMEWAFYGFVLSAALMLLGLLALIVVIAVTGRRRRPLALIPAGTMAAILFYVPAGGSLMLATWLAAAAIAVVLPRTAARSESATL